MRRIDPIYRCMDCGKVFDSEDADSVFENVGEFWGAPAYMTYKACPHCRSMELEEVEETGEEEE